MTNDQQQTTTRREFIQTSTAIAGATALAGTTLAQLQAGVNAGENNTIQLALVGCGGRGSGAVVNAYTVKNGPIKLVAMADVFQGRLNTSYKALNRRYADKMDVPKERQFIGFDGYKKAIDCLNPGDVVIMATPLAFRWVHFTYAIEKGVNVFMEKPLTADGPTSRRMLALGEEASKKNLKVAVGLMCRHCKARQELKQRIDDGAIGDILELRAYRESGPTGSAFTKKRKKADGLSELMYQIKNFHGFLWASGGAFSDFLIHNIDESCWMKGAWPVKADGTGGRHYKDDYVDQNFDSYSVEYTFADGTKLMVKGRGRTGCKNQFASYAHGTKGSAVISTSSHHPARCRIYKGYNMTKENLTWSYPQPEPNPYETEWDDLIAAIRKDQPYNEVKRGVEASLVTSMGRLAAHTGKVITFDEMLNHKHEFAPNVDQLTLTSDAPLESDEKGIYPIPTPGFKGRKEY